MKIKTTIALTCLLLAGCEAKVKIETKTSEPATFITNSVVVQEIKSTGLTAGSPDYWLALMSIYRCDDGTFELVTIDGEKLKSFETLEGARSWRTNLANSVAGHHHSVPAKACGVKIE